MPLTVTGTDLGFTGAGGLELAATSYGDTDAAGVLLLHGFGQARGAWREVGRQLAEHGWHVITLDLRGHGDSEWAPGYRFADFEEDVRLVVAAAFRHPPALIGASMGGILALLTQADTRLAGAIGLIDVVPQFDLESGQRIQAFMATHRDGFPSLEAAADAVASHLEHRARPDNPSGLLRNLRADETGWLRWKWDPRFADGLSWLADHPGDDLRAVADHVRGRMLTAAASLDVPTLLVRGRLSTFVSAQAAQAFADIVPYAELVDVAHAGHMVAGDRNDVFADAVVGFLQRHHPPR